MSDIAVVNASPLIFLAGVDRLDLLRFAGNDEVIIPGMVWQEVVAHGRHAGTIATMIEKYSWFRQVPTPATIPDNVISWNLGRGESAVIACALANKGSTIILDDLAARRCARSLDVRLVGTLGLIIRGYQQGTVKDPRDLLFSMRERGMWVSDRVLANVLRGAGIEP